jgi:hypothetical protein
MGEHTRRGIIAGGATAAVAAILPKMADGQPEAAPPKGPRFGGDIGCWIWVTGAPNAAVFLDYEANRLTWFSADMDGRTLYWPLDNEQVDPVDGGTLAIPFREGEGKTYEELFGG